LRIVWPSDEMLGFSGGFSSAIAPSATSPEEHAGRLVESDGVSALLEGVAEAHAEIIVPVNSKPVSSRVTRISLRS